MKRILLILLLLNTYFSEQVNGQDITDSVVIQYLRTLKDVDAPFLEVSKKKNKTIRTSNFFIEPMDSIRHGNHTFCSFLFGPTQSHYRKYFLLKINSPNKVVHKIIDKPTLESAISILFNCISEFELFDKEKSVLVRGLTYAYN